MQTLTWRMPQQKDRTSEQQKNAYLDLMTEKTNPKLVDQYPVKIAIANFLNPLRSFLQKILQWFGQIFFWWFRYRIFLRFLQKIFLQKFYERSFKEFVEKILQSIFLKIYSFESSFESSFKRSSSDLSWDSFEIFFKNSSRKSFMDFHRNF